MQCYCCTTCRSSMIIKGEPHKLGITATAYLAPTPPHCYQMSHPPIRVTTGLIITMDIISCFSLTMNLVSTTSGHPCTCSTEHQMLVTNTVSTQPTVLLSVTNTIKVGKMYIKGEPKFPNVLVGRFRSFGTRHCVAVWLVPLSSGSRHTPLDPEDEGTTLLPNTANHLPNTMLSHLQHHCCKNLKSHMFRGNFEASLTLVFTE